MKFSASSHECKQLIENLEKSSPDLVRGRREHLHPLTVLGEASDPDALGDVGANYNAHGGRLLQFEEPMQPVPAKFPSLPRCMLSVRSVDIPDCTKYACVLVLSICTEQELQDTLLPLFYVKGGEANDVNLPVKVIGNNFRHGIEIHDSEQSRIDLVLVVVTMDGQVFEQVAFAAFIATSLRAHFDIMPVISRKESELLLHAIAGEPDAPAAAERGEYLPIVTRDGRTVLVDPEGNEAVAHLDLPDGIENIIGTEGRPQRIVMESGVALPGDDDPTEVVEESKAEQDGIDSELHSAYTQTVESTSEQVQANDPPACDSSMCG